MTKKTPELAKTTTPEYLQRVYIEDTDQGGIVYHANFLKYAERARTEMFRAWGFDCRSVVEKYRCYFVVKKIDIQYLSPARMDDLLRVITKGIALRTAGAILRQEILCDDRPVATLDISLVWVNEAMRPEKMPAEIVACFNKLMME